MCLVTLVNSNVANTNTYTSIIFEGLNKLQIKGKVVINSTIWFFESPHAGSGFTKYYTINSFVS